MLKRASLITLVLAALSGATLSGPPTLAADSEGRFAAKGFAQQTCATFAEAWNKDGSDKQSLRDAQIAWLNGYLTAANQYLDATFDLAGWRSTPYLTASLAAHCRTMGDKPVMSAVQAMARKLSSEKLETATTSIAFGNGASKIRMYQPIYKQMVERLVAGAYLEAKADRFNAPEVATAIGAFQADQSLPVTGLPDEMTLFLLLEKG